MFVNVIVVLKYEIVKFSWVSYSIIVLYNIWICHKHLILNLPSKIENLLEKIDWNYIKILNNFLKSSQSAQKLQTVFITIELVNYFGFNVALRFRNIKIIKLLITQIILIKLKSCEQFRLNDSQYINLIIILIILNNIKFV